jgi:pimeloyl-ACP methyl ester carboxylesterase
MKDEYIQVGDIEMCCDMVGEGTPLVLIMGYTASKDWWQPEFVERLAARHRILLMDNRGAGKSSSGNRTFTIKRFADDTALLMAELGIRKADILGASMGGMIAQEFAINYPGKTDNLVLMCTSCGGIHATPPRPAALKPLVKRYPTAEEQMRNSIDVLYPAGWAREHPEAVEATIAAATAAPISPANAFRQMGAIARHHTYSRLPLVKNRTLVMCGDSDVLLPPRNSRTIVSRIPGAELNVYANGGHGFAMQFTDEVTSDVNEFLEG